MLLSHTQNNVAIQRNTHIWSKQATSWQHNVLLSKNRQKLHRLGANIKTRQVGLISRLYKAHKALKETKQRYLYYSMCEPLLRVVQGESSPSYKLLIWLTEGVKRYLCINAKEDFTCNPKRKTQEIYACSLINLMNHEQSLSSLHLLIPHMQQNPKQPERKDE